MMVMQQSAQTAAEPRYLSGERPSTDRRRPDRGIFQILFSPASAAAFSLLAYYSFAGFSNAIAPDSPVGGVIIRVAIIAVLFICYLKYYRLTRPIPGLALMPVGILLTLYLIRLVENIYLSDLNVPPGALVIFPVYILGSIIPSLMLPRLVTELRSDHFIVVSVALLLCYLAGLAVNLAALMDSADHRLRLEKINPIVLAHTAVSFLLILLLYFRQSKAIIAITIATAPILLLIIVQARSRGPYLAGAFTIVAYIALIKGSARVWAILAAALASIAAVYYAADYLEVIGDQFERTDIHSDQSTQLHYIAAVGALQQFLDDFVIGRYVIELQTEFYPHNIFLEVPMALGIVGLVPFLIHCTMATRATIAIVRSGIHPNVNVFIALLFIRESISAGLAGSVWGSSGFWITSCMVIGIHQYWRSGRLDDHLLLPTIPGRMR